MSEEDEKETIEVEDPDKVMVLDDDEYDFLCRVADDMEMRHPADVLEMILQNARTGYDG